jgi:hypothetical protein
MSVDPADLANLHDFAMPPPVPWWPPPIGWWMIAVGLSAMAMVLTARTAARFRANAYRRAAARELAEIPADAGAAAIAELLKRTALAAYPRVAIASLTGTAWLEFLDRTGTSTDFTTGPGRVLPLLVCGGSHSIDARQRVAIVDCVGRWIRNHLRC